MYVQHDSPISGDAVGRSSSVPVVYLLSISADNLFEDSVQKRKKQFYNLELNLQVSGKLYPFYWLPAVSPVL